MAAHPALVPSGAAVYLAGNPLGATAARVHREAHGLEAHTLHEVTQGA